MLNFEKKIIEKHLVTGGAGFLGSHLVEKLMQSNQEVICLDNFFTGSKKNIQEWIQTPNFKLISKDVTEPIILDVDKIWHFACPGSPFHYQSNPIETAKTNFLGTLNMLKLAQRTGAKLLFASTSEIYGDPKINPQPENYFGNVNPNGIRSCYDEGKRISETLCSDFQRIYNLDIKIVRIFNTYGPRMLANDGRVISNFIIQGLQNKPLTIYGNGNQTRSFCYVDDMIDAILKIMASQVNGPINIGHSLEVSIKELAEIIKNKINPSLEFIYKPLPSDDPLKRNPDLEKVEKIINWFPNTSLEDGIAKTILWFKKNNL